MKTASIVQMVVRTTGLIQLVQGFIVWPGNTDFLIPVHILMGSALVIALLILSYLAARSRISTGLVILAVVWNAIKSHSPLVRRSVEGCVVTAIVLIFFFGL